MLAVIVVPKCYKRKEMTFHIYIDLQQYCKLVKYTHGLTVSQKREVHTAHKKSKFPLIPSSHTHTNKKSSHSQSTHMYALRERERERMAHRSKQVRNGDTYYSIPLQ